MFQAGVTSTDDDAIDLLMGVKTPGADNLLGGQEPQDGLDPDADPDLEEPQPKKKGAKPPVKTVDTLSSEEFDNELFQGGEELDADGKPKAKNPDPKDKATPKKTEPKKTVLPEGAEIDYSAIYQKMVDDGVWGEVVVPEGREWDSELFKEVQALQTKTQYEDLLDKTGPYGKKIIEFEKNGGNPGELLSLFREQREVQEFDIKEAEGQEAFLREYLGAQNYSEKSIDRTIKALVDQGEDALKEEAEEKKALWDSQYSAAVEAREKEQALEARNIEEEAKKFQKTITDTLVADGDASPKEKKDLKDYILNYNQNYRGRQVSQFFVDMAEIQKNPENYLELAKFIKGIKTGEYQKKITDKTKKEVNAKSFLKIKNSASLTGNSGTNPDVDTEGSSFVRLLSGKK